MRTGSLPIFLALVALACPAASDSTAEKAAPTDAKPTDTKPADTKSPDTKPMDAKPTDAKPTPDPAVADKRAKAKAKFTGADDAALGKRRTELLAALNEGRKLVKDGEFESGIAKYQALLAIAPNHGPALGELGWAEFKLEKFDDAHAHTQRALAKTEDPKKRGMLLYNLGRVAEARGENEAAIGHYQASLAARPNDVVSERLKTLQAAAPTPVVAPPAGETVPNGLGVLGKDLASVEAMCEAVGRDSLCGGDDCEIVETPAGETGVGLLLQDDGMVRCWQPAIQTPAGWVVFEDAMIGQHGTEVDQDVDELATRIEKNDAGEFLVIEFSDHVYERIWSEIEDEDDDIPEWTSEDRNAVIICRRDGVPACTTPITVHQKYEGPGEEGSYSASVTLRGDVVVVGDVAASGIFSPSLEGGGWDGYMKLPAGEYSLADLAKPWR